MKQVIGTKAIYAYLTPFQKEILVKEFNLVDENELYLAICVDIINEICMRAAKMVGAKQYYAQINPNIKPKRTSKANITIRDFTVAENKGRLKKNRRKRK